MRRARSNPCAETMLPSISDFGRRQVDVGAAGTDAPRARRRRSAPTRLPFTDAVDRDEDLHAVADGEDRLAQIRPYDSKCRVDDSAGTYRLRVVRGRLRSSGRAAAAGAVDRAGPPATSTTSATRPVRHRLIQGSPTRSRCAARHRRRHARRSAPLALDGSDDGPCRDDDSGRCNARIATRRPTTGLHWLEASEDLDDDHRHLSGLGRRGVAATPATTIIGTRFADAVNAAGGNDRSAAAAATTCSSAAGRTTRCAARQATTCCEAALGADILVGGLGNDMFTFLVVGHSQRRRARPDPRRRPGRAFDGAGGGLGSPGDRIDLSAIDANVNVGNDQTFIFGGVGAGRLSAVASRNQHADPGQHRRRPRVRVRLPHRGRRRRRTGRLQRNDFML